MAESLCVQRVHYQGPDNYRVGVLIITNPAIVQFRTQILVNELTSQYSARKQVTNLCKKNKLFMDGARQSLSAPRVHYQGPNSYRDGVLITTKPATVQFRTQILVNELTSQCFVKNKSPICPRKMNFLWTPQGRKSLLPRPGQLQTLQQSG